MAMHLRNVVCAREFLDSSATYFAVSMTEVLRVLFLEIKSSFALNKEVIDQMVHRAISFLLRIAYAITKFGAPRDDRVTTNEPQVGWDPSFLPPHSPTYRARPRNASARENGCHGPNRTEATSHVWNRSSRHPHEVSVRITLDNVDVVTARETRSIFIVKQRSMHNSLIKHKPPPPGTACTISNYSKAPSTATNTACPSEIQLDTNIERRYSPSRKKRPIQRPLAIHKPRATLRRAAPAPTCSGTSDHPTTAASASYLNHNCRT